MTGITLNKRYRSTQYYQLQDAFDALYNSAQNNKTFNNLTSLVFHEDNIRLAYCNLKSNKGSIAPGLDKINIKHIENWTTERLVKKVQEMSYNFQPSKVKRVWIPKPNGDRRPIGIPTLLDRLFQQSIRQVLEPICEAHFHPHSYGFRPNRSTKHALARCAHLINQSQLYYVVDLDIKSFFDTINHGKLIKQIWSLGIRDKTLIKILSKMLKAEIDEEGIPSKGTPQGGILSPLLNNVVLNELDWWLSSQWLDHPTRHKYAQSNLKFRALKQSQLKQFYGVRYADDFKIFCSDYATAVKVFKVLHATKLLNSG